MNAIETIKYRKRLEEGGVPPAQALAHADALAEVLEELPTKDWVRAEISRQLQDLKIDLLKWMFAMFIAQTGVTIGTVIALIRYLPH
ncbi:hypothetical protein GTP55_20250 [Duganella sp. FT109W]|jgi:hypothetical protein|uniref:DUF1640 domain-containing protein n=1 Tax=Duganella margarita TaxID=2692170 RepID=A0A7X4H3M8_9BURK|nr:hypothetical protein [Duganella margarita]MYM74014.1 hypothetical protein [Duganella margarita]MYN41694.1 hypothetical protein [Duganella margarita]